MMEVDQALSRDKANLVGEFAHQVRILLIKQAFKLGDLDTRTHACLIGMQSCKDSGSVKGESAWAFQVW